DDADLGAERDEVRVLDRRTRRERADDDASEHVADDQRLPQQLRQRGATQCREEQDAEVEEEAGLVHYVSARSANTVAVRSCAYSSWSEAPTSPGSPTNHMTIRAYQPCARTNRTMTRAPSGPVTSSTRARKACPRTDASTRGSARTFRTQSFFGS